MATPDFFSTMRIPLRAGRLLNESDSQIGDPDAGVSIVINETAARSYWPGRNPIGATARLSQPDGSRFEVVGVVGDVRNNGLNRPAAPEMYLCRRSAPRGQPDERRRPLGPAGRSGDRRASAAPSGRPTRRW